MLLLLLSRLRLVHSPRHPAISTLCRAIRPHHDLLARMDQFPLHLLPLIQVRVPTDQRPRSRWRGHLDRGNRAHTNYTHCLVLRDLLHCPLRALRAHRNHHPRLRRLRNLFLPRALPFPDLMKRAARVPPKPLSRFLSPPPQTALTPTTPNHFRSLLAALLVPSRLPPLSRLLLRRNPHPHLHLHPQAPSNRLFLCPILSRNRARSRSRRSRLLNPFSYGRRTIIIIITRRSPCRLCNSLPFLHQPRGRKTLGRI